ncbi:unnamed protein product [Dovyalis caffra]|uniref:Myb/SANT-like domain-containing protein n=1 Tax=Dovyalis caffra TaxID=77055 RepID=A0AAV1S4H5_9ROSI|nr:unnamed protein product [Dovyalis caffra]
MYNARRKSGFSKERERKQKSLWATVGREIDVDFVNGERTHACRSIIWNGLIWSVQLGHRQQVQDKDCRSVHSFEANFLIVFVMICAFKATTITGYGLRWQEVGGPDVVVADWPIGHKRETNPPSPRGVLDDPINKAGPNKKVKENMSDRNDKFKQLYMEGETGNQSKQERFRTRWTPSLDKIFADLVVQQIQLGNRPNNVFDKKTWNHIRDQFNKETDSNFNNNQLRKHLDVLRTRFNNVKSAYAQNDFALEDPCGVGFDLWEESFGAQPRPETVKVKDCPIYEQLCKIFTDTSADGKYAQSSHFEGLDKGNYSVGGISCPDGGTSRSEDPSSSKLVKGNAVSSEKAVKNVGERKRKRPLETPSSEQNNRDQELNEAMAEALLKMVAASKWREFAARQNDEKFTITNCIKALDEIQNIDQQLYFAALDLFEDSTLRETFLSLKGDDIRLTWLQGKCGSYNHFGDVRDAWKDFVLWRRTTKFLASTANASELRSISSSKIHDSVQESQGNELGERNENYYRHELG